MSVCVCQDYLYIYYSVKSLTLTFLLLYTSSSTKDVGVRTKHRADMKFKPVAFPLITSDRYQRSLKVTADTPTLPNILNIFFIIFRNHWY